MEEEKERLKQDLKIFLEKNLDKHLLKALSQREIVISRSDFLDVMRCAVEFAQMQKFNAVADIAKSVMRDSLSKARKKLEITTLDEDCEFSDDLKKI